VLLTKVNNKLGIVLCTWATSNTLIAYEEVMAVTDQDGFIPGQIYHRSLPKERYEDGEFITGLVLFVRVCFSFSFRTHR